MIETFFTRNELSRLLDSPESARTSTAFEEEGENRMPKLDEAFRGRGQARNRENRFRSSASISGVAWLPLALLWPPPIPARPSKNLLARTEGITAASVCQQATVQLEIYSGKGNRNTRGPRLNQFDRCGFMGSLWILRATFLSEWASVLDEFFHRWRKETRVWKDTTEIPALRSELTLSPIAFKCKSSIFPRICFLKSSFLAVARIKCDSKIKILSKVSYASK